jgi:hypothetical protein
MSNGIPLWPPILAAALLLLLAAVAAVWLWILYDRATRAEKEIRELARLFTAAYQPSERHVPQENLEYILRRAQGRCPRFIRQLTPILDQEDRAGGDP